jgi:HEPN domain-containing protein
MHEQIEEIKRWIIKGDHDLGTAKITFLHIPEYLDTVTFHCQQSAEKYLKAYLIFLGINFRKTHDLVYLLDLIAQKDSGFEGIYDSVTDLESYAVEVRYPNDTIFLTKDKVESAISTARNIRSLITSKMKIEINYNKIIES